MRNLKIASLAVALALSSTTLITQAATPPDNVGSHLLFGNIVANSPMWQWTVNAYPGGRLDAKPSTATKSGNNVTYPLANAQWFIAASGYLPSSVSLPSGLTGGDAGFTDKTSLSSPDGAITTNVTTLPSTITLPAKATSTAGIAITGTLTLQGDEVRGALRKVMNGASPSVPVSNILIKNGATASDAVHNGSCWVGSPAQPVANWAVTGSGTVLPVLSRTTLTESGAINAFNTNLGLADTNGNVKYSSTLPTATVSFVTDNAGCLAGSPTNNNADRPYGSAAHVLALKPVSVTFPGDVLGQWSATLTVTAYQM